MNLGEVKNVILGSAWRSVLFTKMTWSGRVSKYKFAYRTYQVSRNVRFLSPFVYLSDRVER